MTGAMTPTETASASERRVATLSIGGVRVQLTASDPDLTLDIPPSAMSFACDHDHPDARLEARLEAIARGTAGPVAFASGGVWTLRQSARELVFDFHSPLFGALPYKIARFRPDFSTGEVVLHRPYFRRRLTSIRWNTPSTS